MKLFDKNIFKQPFFWTSICSLLALGILVGLYSYAWVAPTANPNNSAGAGISFSGGNVGIGTTAPGEKLSVLKNGTDATILYNLELQNRYHFATSTGLGVGIKFSLGDPSESGKWAAIEAVSESGWETTTGLAFRTGQSAGATEKVRITNTGNVGIGTTAPGEKLEVAGNIKITGTGNGIKFPDGTSQTTAATASTVRYSVGESAYGGTVAYLLKSGEPGYVAGQQHGLIAAASDNSTGIIWAIAAYQSTSVPAPGATATALGTGLANSNAIVSQNGAGTTYAAGLCRAYTGGGYSDWYLPSKDELNKLYLNKTAIGGFAANGYWSSSESSASSAWSQYFNTGTQTNYNLKHYTSYVRCVRGF